MYLQYALYGGSLLNFPPDNPFDAEAAKVQSDENRNFEFVFRDCVRDARTRMQNTYWQTPVLRSQDPFLLLGLKTRRME